MLFLLQEIFLKQMPINKLMVNKYEKARIIGARAFQLALNAKPNVEISPSEETFDIASKEFYEEKIPLRPLSQSKSNKKE